MAADQDLRDVGQRVEQLLGELQGADPEVAAQAEELVRLLVELYGAGLERMLEITGESDPALLQRLGDDQLVASLLVLHGIHPVPIEERIERSLATVRRGLGLNAGGLSVLGIDDNGVLHVRFEGSCGGCGSSVADAKTAVDEAIEQWAPELNIGLVRSHWRGFDGGQEVWEAVDTFFAGLRQRSRPYAPVGS